MYLLGKKVNIRNKFKRNIFININFYRFVNYYGMMFKVINLECF